MNTILSLAAILLAFVIAFLLIFSSPTMKEGAYRVLTAFMAKEGLVRYMATTTEGNRISDWLKWEEDQRFSREEIVLLSGQNLKTGTVLGKTLVGAAGAATAFAGNTGNGVMGAITVNGAAKVGTYKLVVIEPGANVGTFEVEDPDGKIIGRGAVATLFNTGGLSFTLADGATDFVSGDGFDIVVTGGTEKFKAYDPTATTGEQVAAAILCFDTDASAADTKCAAIVRHAILGKGGLTWGAGVTTAQHKTDAYLALKARGIQSRETA
jgi:hypothetical protein